VSRKQTGDIVGSHVTTERVTNLIAYKGFIFLSRETRNLHVVVTLFDDTIKRKRKTYFTLHRLADEINAPQTSVLVASVERLERVAKIGLGRVAGQVRGQIGTTAVRTIPRADDRVGYHQRDVVRVEPSATFDCDGNVRKRHVVITYANIRA